jgi:tetratricopeptide (TPR) repeat protein
MRSIGKCAYPLNFSLTWIKNHVEKLIQTPASLFIVSLFGIIPILCGSRSTFAIDNLSSNPQVLYAQGLMREQKWSEAAQVYQSLLENYKGNKDLIQDLATAQVFQGKRLEGISLLIQLKPRVDGPLLRELESKLNVLSRSFLTNKNFERYQEGVNALEQRKLAQAESLLLKALHEEPYHLETTLKIAQCLIFEEKYDEAINRLNEIKSWTFFAPEISQWLGRALFLKAGPTQSINKAIVELKIAFSRIQGSEELVVWLAEAYVAMGQSQEALHILDQDVQTHPFHIVSILTSARIRIQTAKGDLSILWTARKSLQLALSRLSQEHNSQLVQAYELTQRERKKPEEIQAGIQKLLQQVQLLLEEHNPRS